MNRQQSAPQLLVYAEEVDLGHLHGLVVHAHVHGHRGDAAHQRVRLRVAHADVPLLQIARRSQRPLQKGHGIVETERKKNKNKNKIQCNYEQC